MYRKGFLPSGCSKHPGELLQQYCYDCVELLCLRCIINTGETHRLHKLLDYRTFLQQQERKAKTVLHRLNEIRVKGDHLKTLLSCYDSDFKQSYEECETNLKSFEFAKKEMLKWRSDLLANMEAKKVAQLKILDEAIEATRQGQLSTEPITVQMPKLTINVRLQSKLQEKAGELVPKSFSNLIRANSADSGRSSRKLVSRVHSHDDIRSSSTKYDDDLQSIISNSSQRSVSPSVISSDSYYDEIDDLPTSLSSSRHSTFDSLNLGETAAYSKVSAEGKSIDDRPKMPTPTETNASVFFKSQADESQPKSLCSVPKPTREVDDNSNLSSQKEVLDSEALKVNKFKYKEVLPQLFGESSDGKKPPLPSSNSFIALTQSQDETYVSTNELHKRPEPYEDYLKIKQDSSSVAAMVQSKTNSPMTQRKLYSSPCVSPIVEQPYDDHFPVKHKDSSSSSFIHPLSVNIEINSQGKNQEKHDEKEEDQEEKLEPIYDSLDYTRVDYSKNEVLLQHVEYSEPYDWRKQRPLTSYQQLDPPSLRTESYATPTQSPRVSASLSPEHTSNTLPKEVTIPPAHTILASCFAENFTESVSLFDVCINSDGVMIFSDRENNCIRCLWGTQEESNKKSKYFIDGLQPRALTYDNANRQIIMSTNKGLYLVECSTHFSKMKEKRIAKNVIPLSMACSTVPVKRKGVSLLYMTLWPKVGDSCVYKIDTNGEIESKISSPDINNKRPLGIDYFNEYFVVTNIENGTIIKMSHKGDPLWDSSVDARTPEILDQPFGVAILPRSEYIAVTEPEAHRISIFTDKGKLLLRLGKKGTERGEFNTPRGIAVRLMNELVVVDSGNKRIQIFSLNSLPGLPVFRSFSEDYNKSVIDYSPYMNMSKAKVWTH